MTDLSVCHGCGGEADNGHDRCVPPNVYLCSKCQALPTRNPWDDAEYIRQKEEQERKARRAELVWEAVLAHIASGRPHYSRFDLCVRQAERDADAFLAWEAEQ